MKEIKDCIKAILNIQNSSVKVGRYELYYSKHAGKYRILHFDENSTVKDDEEDFLEVDDAVLTFIKRSNPTIK